MIDNRLLAGTLLRARRVDGGPDALAAEPPPPLDHGPRLADRVRGLLLGLAIGDALGSPGEAFPPRHRCRRFGEIRDYLPGAPRARRPLGLPTDDTQLTFRTLAHLLELGGLAPEPLAARLAGEPLFAPGATLRTFVEAYRATGGPWSDATQPSAGNGALKRIAPVLLPHLRQPGAALWADTVLCAAVTHNDVTSTGTCLAWVGMLWDLLASDAPPPEAWWVNRLVARLRPVEGERALVSRRRGDDFRGPLWRLLAGRVRRAMDERLPVIDAAELWASGPFLLETVPTLVYILARHGHDPEEAMVRAANDVTDAGTITACVGAAMGALHGAEALPARWRDGLSGRLGLRDDGTLFELVERAVARWVDGAGAGAQRRAKG